MDDRSRALMDVKNSEPNHWLQATDDSTVVEQVVAEARRVANVA